MPRAFTAIDIPSGIAETLRKKQNELGLGKPVDPEKMHITLEFFESVKSSEIDKIIDQLRRLETQPFKIRIEGLGAFPSRKYIRVLWAGVESKRLFDVYQKCSNHSLESDNSHDFNPHVTLSRIDDFRRRDKKRINNFLDQHTDTVFGEFEANQIKFYRSDLEAGGSKYSVIHSENLR